MAAFHKTAAAVCLVALSGIRSEATEETTYKLKAQDVTEYACAAVSLALNGRLPVHIKVVTEDNELVSKLTEKKEIFHQALEYPMEESAAPNYRQTLQGALTAGEDYFTGIIAPTTDLADMTDEDLKAPTNDDTAAAAVPTILFAGLVAMLTAISV
ncbi:hypothetical protein EBH_0046680 [Eimeria brunetti]|uniref:SAG family member n=1 Tax=Eimeria brunetti TaxID=51314 RepID=U6LAR5_9EIME|nr:hypothetical protein EBH_0046680 [Eimeria brunetti]